MTASPPELTLADAAAWRAWLVEHGRNSGGVWLVLAKRGTTDPTSLTYADALDEALCEGWIDGQLRARDVVTFLRRFTPRRPGGLWSAINARKAEELIAAGRMRPAGLAEVERARADGRWDKAYAGAATAEVPADLAAALAADPAASAMFATLSGTNRYAILYRVNAAKRPDTRERRIATFVAMLRDGKTIHPQPKPKP